MIDPDFHQINQARLEDFREEIRNELDNILHFWTRLSRDKENGGFVGKMDNLNKPVPGAPKGSVLHTRILWTFSAAYGVTGSSIHLEMAAAAFHYIRDHFQDPVHGGLYWSVKADGNPLDTHKQIYAQSFGIYGMSEYYRAAKNEQALALAIEWYRLIERYALDTVQGGYIDAFDRNWSFLADKRLSAKDENALKTMNTHLHILEAYANLYTVWPDPQLRIRILQLLDIFYEKILDKKTNHLQLFFDEQWNPDPGIISYGHDIEAGWLLQSCAISVGDEDRINLAKANALRITDAAREGLDEDGGLWYELNIKSGQLIRQKHWWPQAEALIGFCNAWQISGNPLYLHALRNNWTFIRKYILDQENGEWFWGINADHSIMAGEDKIGLWKCPYHNSRACIELLKRLDH